MESFQKSSFVRTSWMLRELMVLFQSTDLFGPSQQFEMPSTGPTMARFRTSLEHFARTGGANERTEGKFGPTGRRRLQRRRGCTLSAAEGDSKTGGWNYRISEPGRIRGSLALLMFAN